MPIVQNIAGNAHILVRLASGSLVWVLPSEVPADAEVCEP